MRLHTSRIAAVAVAMLPTLASAVKLADMKPRASNLPTACDEVYQQQIDGCEPEDFMTQDCSSACYSALQALTEPIQDACGNEGISGQNLIVAYLANVGPQQLCSNGATSSAGSSSSDAETEASATPTPTASATKESTEPARQTSSSRAHDSASHSASKSMESIARPTTTHDARPSMVFDGSSSTSAESSTTRSASDSTDTGTADTGGGSPFDIQYSGTDSLSATSVLLSLAVAVFVIFAVFR